MKVLIYTASSSINVITRLYLDIITSAFLKLNYSVEETNEIDLINRNIVLTVGTPDFFRYRRANSNNFFIHRFGGITEEAHMLFKTTPWYKRFLYLFRSDYLERNAMKHNHFRFVMSEAMKSHFISKYKIKDNGFFVMPCFNTMPDAIQTKQVTAPKFVYVGSLHKWQCAHETIENFAEIQKLIPEASLTFLTKEIDEALALFKEYSLKNTNAFFVPFEKLNDELKKYKYAFLLREDNIINNVATPTKMNSYLSNHLIPIYTNVVDAFEKNIDLNDFAIKLTDINAFNENAKLIEAHHNNIVINIEAQKKAILQIFKTFYNKDYYLEKMTLMLKKQLPKH